jgi:hypothetical protein
MVHKVILVYQELQVQMVLKVLSVLKVPLGLKAQQVYLV